MMQLAQDKYAVPSLSHQRSEAPGTRGALDRIELLADRFSFARNTDPPQVLTLGIIQVHSSQSNHVTFTKSVFIRWTLPFLTGIQNVLM